MSAEISSSLSEPESSNINQKGEAKTRTKHADEDDRQKTVKTITVIV